MQRYPIHGYGIPQLMNQIIPAVMKQQGIAQQREEQMRQEQVAAREKQRQDKLAEAQWKRGKQFDMAMKTGDFILKAKDLPYNVLKPAVDMFVKAGKTVGYDFDARALLDETQRKDAIKTGIQNKLGELFEKASAGDPKAQKEFMVANSDYAKVNGGKLHEVFGPAMQELTKNAMSPSGGMTGDMGQLEQAKRMLQRQGGMGGGQPNINQPNPLNPGQMMASSTAGGTANMGPMQLLQKLREAQTDQEPYKIGTVKEFKEGDKIVTRRYLGNGKWSPNIVEPASTKTKMSSLKQEYEDYKKDTPSYKGSMLDYHKAKQQKDLMQVAVSLAQKDLKYMSGQEDLGTTTNRVLQVLQGTSTSKEMESMPPADKYNGKTIKDTTTGKRYKSNGKKWIEIK